MIWKGIMVVKGSESKIVVVISGSMEKDLNSGDLIFMKKYKEEKVRVGEIVVFKVEGREINIVNRVIKINEKVNGKVKLMKKGEKNSVDDRGIYENGKMWLKKKDVVGSERGLMNYVGMVKIYMKE
jgi:signal peptidase